MGVNSYETGKTNEAMTKEWLKSTTATYSNWIKVKERTMNDYNRDALAVNQWRKDYEGKTGLFTNPDDTFNESRKYFKDMRTMFNTGSVKDFNEMYTLAFMAKISDHLNNGWSFKKAIKLAESNMKTKMKSLNPLKYSWNKEKDRLVSPMEGFWNSLDREQKKTAVKVFAQYKKKINDWDKQYAYWLREQSLEEFIKPFKMKMSPELEDAWLKSMEKEIKKLK
jgi:hypothetical protein